MIKTIYRGYDIKGIEAAEGKKLWSVFDPKNSNVIAVCNTEEEAQNFVDKHKRNALASK